MKIRKSIGLVVLASVVAGDVTQASVVTNHNAIVSDTFIRGAEHASENYGTNAAMSVRNNISALGFARKIYIKVDVKSLLGPGEVFADAALNLVFHSGTSGVDDTFQIYGITDNADTWDEGTITWNEAPKNDTTSGDGVLSGATLLATVSSENTAAKSVLSFSSDKLTGYLNWTAGKAASEHGSGEAADTFATFIIVSSSTSAMHSFASKDGKDFAGHPYLSYTITPQPTGPVPAN